MYVYFGGSADTFLHTIHGYIFIYLNTTHACIYHAGVTKAPRIVMYLCVYTHTYIHE